MVDLSNFLSGVICGFAAAVFIPFPRGGDEGDYCGPAELFDGWVEQSFAVGRLFLNVRYAMIVAISILTGCFFIVIGR